MTVSELAKRCFNIMTKMGDIEVVGEIEVINKQLVLLQAQVGLDKDDSEVLPKVLTDESGQSSSVYL